MMNKKGVSTLFLLLSAGLVLIIIYLILFIPIPAFTSLRIIINYFLILIFFILFQIGLILGYYNVGKYTIKGLKFLQSNVVHWSMDIRHLIIRHS